MRLVRRQERRAFSLIELVIVVVIIGIIAAIAIPRMSRGAAGASDSATTADLAVLRSALDLYTTEHGGVSPDSDIHAQLTTYTDAQGNSNASKTSVFIYGPYIRSIPTMPVGSKRGASAIVVTSTASDLPPAGVAADGWWYNSATVDIRTNLANSEVDVSGIQYNAY